MKYLLCRLSQSHSKTVQVFGDYGHIAFFGQVFIDHGHTVYGVTAAVLVIVFGFVAYSHRVHG